MSKALSVDLRERGVRPRKGTKRDTGFSVS